MRLNALVLTMKTDILLSLLETAYDDSEMPESVVEELDRGHEHPENQCLYEELGHLTWREVTGEMIEATYPVFFLLTDAPFAYYLPAVLKHIITSGNRERGGRVGTSHTSSLEKRS